MDPQVLNFRINVGIYLLVLPFVSLIGISVSLQGDIKVPFMNFNTINLSDNLMYHCSL